MNRVSPLVGVLVVLLTIGCGRALMSFGEYAARQRSFPYVVQIHAASGALFYYGAAHTNDPANPQIADIERAWRAFQPTLAFNEGGAPPALDTVEETVGRNGEAALVRWLARRDGVTVDTLEPPRAAVVAALSPRFSAEQIKVAFVLRGLSEGSRRTEQYRDADVNAEVDRVLPMLSRIRGLEGAPETARQFQESVIRWAPPGSDWRRPPEEWFDPVPAPPPTWFNAFARAESDVRDGVMMQKLVQKVRAGERVFAVVGGSHVVMQERALRSRLASR